ncbi:4-oxalocrotonate decarboxylase [Corynebacterium occultum]|uniref:4-oxalocrotonate decarboxylase n=1 Tax=Corynebacterium occultum TaxID=2675219 RepID=A0A6B8W690_9CORY|nr:fumarylacetoacetate hydrolase family protein [Corynebacterium occultum]QGU06825.1 4-oxalocrotonate decarboxylase [Corynebacterium occultum]
MPINDVESAVDALLQAENRREERGRVTTEWPGLDAGTAYEVQRTLIEAKIAAGEEIVGFKLGLTSKAKQEQMNVDAPLSGWLTDAHQCCNGEPVKVANYIHPRIEPEIAFILGRELKGPNCTRDDVKEATSHITAAFEIIDSRYRDFNFALPDVIADNASSAGFILGKTHIKVGEFDLINEPVELLVDGEVQATATGAAVLGDPAQAVVDAVNEIATRGQSLPAGTIVLTGALTDAVFLNPGSKYTARFKSLGEITVNCL